jgi:putative phosphoesterase
MARPSLVIGLISDTHGLLRPEVAAVFAHVDRIVHAGDVGPGVLQKLSEIAPVEAVSGNVDDPFDPSLPRELSLPAGSLTLHVSHGDELGSPTPDGLLARYGGDILVYGHTHKALVFRDPDGRLVVNPGSAGPRRFNLQPSVAILTVTDRDASVEIVTLLEKH